MVDFILTSAAAAWGLVVLAAGIKAVMNAREEAHLNKMRMWRIRKMEELAEMEERRDR